MGLSSGLLGYVLINYFTTPGAMLLDKAAAEAHGSRISELKIFFLSLMGSGWGTIGGLFLFRHRTRKPIFQVVIFLIMVPNLAMLYHLLAEDEVCGRSIDQGAC